MPETHQLIETESGKAVVGRLELGNTFWRRFRGLQFRSRLADDQGLLLTGCRSIHTHWMWFAIDVACIDKSGAVIHVAAGIKPWRYFIAPQETFAILETASTAAVKLEPGMQLEVSGASIFAKEAAAR